MQWLAMLLVISFGIGLKQRVGRGAQLLLIIGVVAIVGGWYLQLGHGG